MIKKYLIGVLLTLIIGFNAHSQDEKFEYFISTGLLYKQLPKTIRAASVTDFGLAKNNNQFKIGVIAQIYTDNAESLSQSLKLSGGHLGYGRTIPTGKKWLSLELKSDLNIQHFKSAWTANSFVDELQQYQEFDYKLGETLFDLSVGYGLKFSISPNFYASQSFTGGIYYSLISSDAAQVTDEDFDFRSYGNTGIQWNAMLTFGYYFLRK